jgi:hypothetical protein
VRFRTSVRGLVSSAEKIIGWGGFVGTS